MTTLPKNPKLPLSDSSKKLFLKRFEEIFLKPADKDISDETLMKVVNEYSEQNQNSGQEQEGVQAEGDSQGEFSEEKIAEINKRYFDLFGQKPAQIMTAEQVLNAISVKEDELQKAEKPKVEVFSDVALTDNQVIAVNKAGEQRIFEKQTLKFLPEWKIVVPVPEEVKSK